MKNQPQCPEEPHLPGLRHPRDMGSSAVMRGNHIWFASSLAACATSCQEQLQLLLIII